MRSQFTLQADLNVSLTAINLLWNAADLLAKRSVHSFRVEQADSNRDAALNGSGPGLLNREKFEELLRFLFQSVQARFMFLNLSKEPEIESQGLTSQALTNIMLASTGL